MKEKLKDVALIVFIALFIVVALALATMPIWGTAVVLYLFHELIQKL